MDLQVKWRHVSHQDGFTPTPGRARPTRRTNSRPRRAPNNHRFTADIGSTPTSMIHGSLPCVTRWSASPVELAWPPGGAHGAVELRDKKAT